MSTINWKDLAHKTEHELMELVGKIEHAVENAYDAGKAFYKKHEATIKKAICGHKGSISSEINKENIDALVQELSKALGKEAKTNSKSWEGLAAIAVYALKQGLDKYCAN